jgi:predicted metal-dependent enzyme (double-stranded beta helix superfamily)
MCGTDHSHHHDNGRFGFLVDTPEIRALIGETEQLMGSDADPATRVEALKPAFSKLLSSDAWLPDQLAQPDEKSRMGDGIGQYALYRAEDGSLCLFSLVVPSGASTPVHDHLAWGLVGVYRGEQDETVYRRLDDGSNPAQAQLEIAKRQELRPGDLYALLPPTDFRVGVDLDSSARQRHGVRVAAQVRPRVGCGDAVPFGLRERTLSDRAIGVVYLVRDCRPPGRAPYSRVSNPGFHHSLERRAWRANIRRAARL